MSQMADDISYVPKPILIGIFFILLLAVSIVTGGSAVQLLEEGPSFKPIFSMCVVLLICGAIMSTAVRRFLCKSGFTVLTLAIFFLGGIGSALPIADTRWRIRLEKDRLLNDQHWEAVVTTLTRENQKLTKTFDLNYFAWEKSMQDYDKLLSELLIANLPHVDFIVSSAIVDDLKETSAGLTPYAEIGNGGLIISNSNTVNSTIGNIDANITSFTGGTFTVSEALLQEIEDETKPDAKEGED